MQYTREQAEIICSHLIDKIQLIIAKDDPSESTPLWTVLLFLLEYMDKPDFYGDVVVPLRGDTALQPHINNQTFKIRTRYLDIFSKLES